jgi:ABC-type transport system involved in multi-copper enzyme maturation permease subunit
MPKVHDDNPQTMTAVAAPHDRPGLVGPIFFWELIRQSRKGRGYFTRVLYAAAMLGMLFLLLGVRDITQKNAAYLSEAATSMYLSIQYIAVVLLTPIFVGGAFVEDRQQNTLQLLMTTFLSPRELIVGKMCGRVIHVIAVLLAGVPVLALLQLLGGVNAGQLVLHSCLAFVLMLVCAMYAIRASTLCKTVGGAIMMTYGMFIGGYLLASVAATAMIIFFFALVGPTGFGVMTYWAVAVLLLNVLFAFLALRNAIRSIQGREKDLDYGSMHLMSDQLTLDMHQKMIVVEAPVKTDIKPLEDGQVVLPESVTPQRLHRAIRWKRLPAVSDRPIQWKEKYFPLSDADALIAGICCGLPLTVFLTSFVNLETFQSIQPFMIWCCRAMMMLVLVMTTLRAAGVFAQERLQKSLLSLLSVPLTPGEIVLQAWLGSIRRFSACLIGTALIALTTIVYAPLEVLFLIPAYLTQLAFFTMTALYLSMWRLSPFQTRFIFGVYFFLSLFVLPSFLYLAIPFLPVVVTLIIAPYYSWGKIYQQFDLLGLPLDATLSQPPVVAASTIVLAIVFYAALTLLLFRLARRRLTRMPELFGE